MYIIITETEISASADRPEQRDDQLVEEFITEKKDVYAVIVANYPLFISDDYDKCVELFDKFSSIDISSEIKTLNI